MDIDIKIYIHKDIEINTYRYKDMHLLFSIEIYIDNDVCYIGKYLYRYNYIIIYL